MPRHRLHVVYQDNHLLVVDKPPGLATMGVAHHRSSLVSAAKAYLKAKYHKPGNVFLGIVSRLDSVTSGVIVLARTSKAASRLAAQFRAGQARKQYWAIVERPLDPPAGPLVDVIAKDDRLRRMVVVPSGADARHGARAELTYRTIGRCGGQALVEIELATGRKHQIRVQLAHAGAPVVGDRKYGATSRFPRGIALHSRRLTIEHPTLHQPQQFEVPPPAWWHIDRFQPAGPPTRPHLEHQPPACD